MYLMQIPYRKPSKFSNMVPDPVMSQEKFVELQNKLEKLKKIQPDAAREVSRLAEMGDFSENAEYQLAKGRLRGINNRIMVLENQLNRAEIIQKHTPGGVVRLGDTVTVECNGKQKTYQILGSSETNPEKGIISQTSPIGSGLLGHKVGEIVTISLNTKKVSYRILEIR